MLLQDDYDTLLGYLNLINTSKPVKAANTLLIDGVRTHKVFYVPMIARRFTVDESLGYD